ncbi:caspase family protein [Propionivibrio sp.]|uniref:two-partner secretion domain-containing protein n=1 Tax=Propionivibrio sp. TaxID=2212460 RepID=UPI003BF31060
MKRHTQESARPLFVFKPTLASLAVAACFAHSGIVLANPTGAQIAAGSAQINSTGQTLSVTNTPGTIINWQQFNIGASETTRFVQQSANSAILNRVVGGDMSRIYGTLQSNGQVYLINQSGILFGPNSIIDVNKLVASTLNLSDTDFLAKRFSFAGGGFGPLLNQGRISTPLGGNVYLIGTDVRNEGVITTPQGQVVLAAGNSVSLSDSAGPELSVTLSANGNRAVNLGTITAAGGQINMFGALIDQHGLLSADSASVDAQGRIILKASDSTVVSGTISATNSAGKGGEIQVLGNNVTLTSSASLDASGTSGGGSVLVGGDWQGRNASVQNASNTTMQAGALIKADATGNSDGGKVVLWANDTTDFKGSIFARGGPQGGNGGQVETSGHNQLQLGGTVNTLAPQGTSGSWLLDPAKVCILPNGVTTCSGGSDPMVYMATVMTPTMLDYALSSNGSLTIQATDYLAFMPNGGTYTVGGYMAVPSGGVLNIQAPYVYSNGTFDARTNNVNIKFWIDALGSSSTFSSSSATVEMDSGSKFLLPGSGQPIPGNNFDWYNGSDFRIDAQSGIIARSGALIDVGNPANNSGAVLLHAQYAQNFGGTVKAGLVAFEVDYFSGTPVNIDAWELALSPRSFSSVLLGATSANCPSGSFCFNDMAQFFTGSWKQTTISAWGSSTGTSDVLEVVGPFNPRAPNLTIEASGNVFIRSPLTVAGWLDIYSSYSNVYVNSPVEASYVSIGTDQSGYIKLNSTVTGTGALAPRNTPGDNSNYNPTAIDPTVIFGLGDSTGYTGLIGQFKNVYGPNAVNAGNGKPWWIMVPEGALFDVSGLAGYEYTFYSDINALKAAGYLKNSIWNRNENTSFYVIGSLPPTPTPTPTPTPIIRVEDPCVLNPAICAPIADPTATNPNSIQATVGPVNPALDAPLSIAATLTGDDRYVVRSDTAAEKTITAQLNTSDKAKKTDQEKTGVEVREEAKQAVSDAGKAEMEAKQAEKEALQAEAEANTAKTPQQRENAQRRAEAKRAEADVKKAQAEAKRAEAESRDALADTKQVVAETGAGTGTGTVASVRRSEAETRLARAEIKRADADAKRADAEARQASSEAKSARTPEQKEIAQKTAEARRVEADAKRTESQARKIDAEARQAEAEVKAAPTPQARAVAEKRAESKRTEADVKTSEARSKQATAEGKQAEVKGKQADSRARQAEADAKQAEAEVRSAKSPEQKLAATLKAESRKTEAQAHKAESDARKTEAEGKQVEAQARKAEGDARKSEGEARQAKTPEQKVAAEKRAESKRSEADVKKTEAEAKLIEAEGKQAKAEGKYAEAEAKTMRSPGGRAVSEKRADARKAEGEQKQAEAEVKQAEAGEKKARSEEQQARSEASSAKNNQKKAEAEKRAEGKKAEAESRKAEGEKKKVEAEQKKVVADKKAEEHRVAETRRGEERRSESAKAFGRVTTAGASRESLEALVSLRHELKTEAFKPALNILERNPLAANLPSCAGSAIVCVPDGMPGAITLPPPLMPTASFLPQIQRKVALLVGINNYSDPAIPALDTAQPDAKAVAQQLQDQLGYEVRVLPDASRADIVTSLNRLAREVGPDDSVTIYYAGHGYLNEKSNTGYWIPADAKISSPDQWISNNDIAKLLTNIPAKQIMLVSDSCYSGSLTKEQWISGAGQSDPAKILAKRSVTVMSSGGEEPVSDEGKDGHSIFAYSFMNALKSIKDVEPAGTVFESVKTEVRREFPQVPQYGGAVSAGHTTGGDYLFEARSFK